MHILYHLVIAVYLLALIITAWSLYREREPRGMRRTLTVTFFLLLAWAGASLYSPSLLALLALLLFLPPALVGGQWLLARRPLQRSRPLIEERAHGSCVRLDERDAMFSRAALVPGTPQYESYYSLRPEKKDIDAELRALPGLYAPGSRCYEPLNAEIPVAIFSLLEELRPLASPGVEGPRVRVPPAEMSRRLKGMARYLGAVSAGVAPLYREYLYSHIGRRMAEYGEPVRTDHRFALVYAVEMDYSMVKGAPRVQIGAESSKQYLEAAKIGLSLAHYLRVLGWDARAHIDGNYLVVAPPLAAEAGLGEVSRMGILVTEDYGPRVRLGVVTTDMPLEPDGPVDLGIEDFCRVCMKCADNCPSGAIPRDEMRLDRGILKWTIDQERCYRFWRENGTDCAICMSSCPYSKPNTPVHRPVRLLVRRSSLARRLALAADDWLYGRRPFRDLKPDWMKAGGPEK